ARGPIPVAGRSVRFQILKATGEATGSEGTLSIAGMPSGTDVVRTSGLDGLVAVTWTLDPHKPVQRLVAQLLDDDGKPTSLPVNFSARLRTADVVAYNPKTCSDLADRHALTVQEAIDGLCAADALEYVAGDGQEVTPNSLDPTLLVDVPLDLTVGVIAHGSIP